MKNIGKLVILSCVLITLVSCDPPHNIDFINKSSSNVKVKINLNPKVENYRLKEISTNDSILFNIKPSDTATIYFGIGTWDENEIDELVNSIDNIIIETSEVLTVYKTKSAVKKILERNQEGFWWKTKIIIDIE